MIHHNMFIPGDSRVLKQIRWGRLEHLATTEDETKISKGRIIIIALQVYTEKSFCFPFEVKKGFS